MRAIPTDRIADLLDDLRATLKDGVELLMDAPEVAQIVLCRDCRYCQPLKTTPGFFCERLEKNLYAPHYKDSAWYCADGERRDEDEDAAV